MKATTAPDALITGRVSQFGVPAIVTSDHGTQFTAAIWEILCKKLGIQHVTTTAFHPCWRPMNGLITSRGSC